MADFTFEIHRMSPGIPEYNVLMTDMEGWKRISRMKSTHPRRSWDIEIRGRTNTEKDLILAHWAGQGGANTPFNWTVNPNFFSGGVDTTYYVRYKEMKYENPEGLGNIWNFNISFVEEI